MLQGLDQILSSEIDDPLGMQHLFEERLSGESGLVSAPSASDLGNPWPPVFALFLQCMVRWLHGDACQAALQPRHLDIFVHMIAQQPATEDKAATDPTAAAAQSPAAAAAVDCQSTPCSGSEHLDLASLLQGLSDALYEVARKASDPVFKASAAKRGSATQAQANADSQDSDWISIQVVKRILTCGIELDAASSSSVQSNSGNSRTPEGCQDAGIASTAHSSSSSSRPHEIGQDAASASTQHHSSSHGSMHEVVQESASSAPELSSSNREVTQDATSASAEQDSRSANSRMHEIKQDSASGSTDHSSSPPKVAQDATSASAEQGSSSGKSRMGMCSSGCATQLAATCLLHHIARCRKLGQECKLSLALWTDLVSGLTMQGAAVGEEEVLWQLGRSRSDA